MLVAQKAEWVMSANQQEANKEKDRYTMWVVFTQIFTLFFITELEQAQLWIIGKHNQATHSWDGKWYPFGKDAQSVADRFKLPFFVYLKNVFEKIRKTKIYKTALSFWK